MRHKAVDVWWYDDMGYNAIDLNNINLDVDNFDEDDPTRIVFARLN